MRILPVINNHISALSTFKNNQYDYSQYRGPVLGDRFTFCGKIPDKVYSSNGKNAITSLASFGVTCLCCGKKMIDPSEIAKLEADGLFKSSSQNILETLKQYKSYMKPLEKRVFTLLLRLQQQYPEKNLAKLLETQKHNIEIKLINKQSKTFGKLYDYCVKYLPDEKVEEFSDILNETYDEIYGRKPKTTFGRKKFIGLIYKFTQDIPETHRQKLINIAEELPTSQNQFEAFIIKYSRKKNKEIALRLIQHSTATIEHIKPRAEGGPDHIHNYAIECADDNWARGCRPMIEQIRQNPNMPRNAQKQINQIIRLVNNGKSSVNSLYVIKLKEALYRASGGIIDLDIKALKTDLRPKDVY